MIQKPKTFSEHQADILAALSATGIRQLAPGGKARAFGDIVADKLSQIETRQFSNLADTLLPFAAGNSLDVLGEIYGVYRIQQQSASVEAGDENFRFFVRRGTFGDINNGQDISIPADVRIFTASDAGPVYLADPVILPASANQQFFSARSLYSGSTSNASAKSFSRHNFTNYAESSFGSLLVTNAYGIVGGRDEEDDESYRFRIYQKIRSAGGANESAVRFELLSVSGIQDIAFGRHAGGFTAYVYGISPRVPQSLIDSVQQRINEVVAYPIVGTAVAPDLVGISLATTIRFSGGPTQVEQGIILSQAVSAAEDYINNLRIGEPLILNEIADRIRNADSRILDIGEPNRQLNEIFIWRKRLDDSWYSRSLIANYLPAAGERIVVHDIVGAISLVGA